MKVERINSVVNALRAHAAKLAKDPKVGVTVGYSASYAANVHENIAMAWEGLPRPKHLGGVYWGPRGQAKYLEEPARLLNNDKTLSNIVTEALRKKKTVAQALLLAGLRLQRESQKRVPVVTGTLKNSAFTVVEPIR